MPTNIAMLTTGKNTSLLTVITSSACTTGTVGVEVGIHEGFIVCSVEGVVSFIDDDSLDVVEKVVDGAMEDVVTGEAVNVVGSPEPGCEADVVG